MTVSTDRPGCQPSLRCVPAVGRPARQRVVAGEVGLLLRADRVDVAGLRQGWQSHLELASALQQAVEEESGPIGPAGGDHVLEGIDPLLGLDRVDVRQLLLELVEDVVEALSEPQPVRAAMGPGWERVSLGMVETEQGPMLLIDVAALVAGVEAKAA